MDRLGDFLSFTPRRLAAVRAEVVATHPSIAELDHPPPVGPSVLRERIREASAESDDALRRLAWNLTGRELAQAVRSLAAWEELRDAIRTMVAERPKARFVAPAWRAWEEAPTDELIWSTTRDLIQRFGMEGSPFDAFESTPRWAEVDDPIPGIVRWLEGTAVLPGNLRPPPESPFRTDSPLIRHLERAILTMGSGQHLGALPPWWILEGWRTLSPEPRLVACARYLNLLPSDDWAQKLVHNVQKSYGSPGGRREGYVARFWEGVDDDKERAFRLLFIDAELGRAFAGDSARHRYWRRWAKADRLVDVVTGTGGDTDWVRMDFDGFSVVEFFKTGNAAYFYTDADVRQIEWPQHVSATAALKERRPGLGRLTDNRLLHHRGWQSKADRMVQAWGKKYS